MTIHVDVDFVSFYTGLTPVMSCIDQLNKGIRFIVLYPPRCSHDLPPLAGLYTRKPFQSPEGYSKAAGSIKRTSSKHCLIIGTHFAAR